LLGSFGRDQKKKKTTYRPGPLSIHIGILTLSLKIPDLKDMDMFST